MKKILFILFLAISTNVALAQTNPKELSGADLYRYAWSVMGIMKQLNNSLTCPQAVEKFLAEEKNLSEKERQEISDGVCQVIASIKENPDVNEKAENLGKTTSDWLKKNFGRSTCADNICADKADPDGDDITNAQEYLLGTDPNKSDTDGDGASDSEEIKRGRSPLKISAEGDKIEYENPREKGRLEEKILLVNEVEVKGDKKVRFGGKGLPNAFVTVYVFSQLPTVLTVKTDSNGDWTYELEKDLDEGDHEIYVAINDADGKIIAKSKPLPFVKTAQAGPAPSIEEPNFLSKTVIFAILFGFSALALTLISIGLIISKKNK